MLVFLREGSEIERQRWKRDVIGARAAQHAEADDFKKLLDD